MIFDYYLSLGLEAAAQLAQLAELAVKVFPHNRRPVLANPVGWN
jgi:hypothetical protein